MRSEAEYQRQLVSKIEALFPGCHIEQRRTGTRQGIPDLLILWGSRWAMLEVKRSAKAAIQPNQEHYVGEFAKMSFSAFIYPENEEQVLYDLQSAFGAIR